VAGDEGEEEEGRRRRGKGAGSQQPKIGYIIMCHNLYGILDSIVKMCG